MCTGLDTKKAHATWVMCTFFSTTQVETDEDFNWYLLRCFATYELRCRDAVESFVHSSGMGDQLDRIWVPSRQVWCCTAAVEWKVRSRKHLHQFCVENSPVNDTREKNVGVVFLEVILFLIFFLRKNLNLRMFSTFPIIHCTCKILASEGGPASLY